MSTSRSESGHSWARFFTLTFGDRKRFVRFVIVLVILLTFVVISGWLWGRGVPTLAAAAVGMRQVLRYLVRG
jgi:hypothetical protein